MCLIIFLYPFRPSRTHFRVTPSLQCPSRPNTVGNYRETSIRNLLCSVCATTNYEHLLLCSSVNLNYIKLITLLSHYSKGTNGAKQDTLNTAGIKCTYIRATGLFLCRITICFTRYF